MADAADADTAASVSGEPQPEDSLLVALQKLYKQSTLDVLGPAANWLNQNFGVIEYADLESVQSMADMAMGIIAEDTSVSGDSKAILRELLGKGAGAAEAAPPAVPMEQVFKVPEPVTQPTLDETQASGEKPQPQDTVLVALQKLFSEDPPEVLEPAAAWLDKNFGVVEYADLEGVKTMADTVMDLVGGDSSLSAQTKDVLGCVFGRKSRAAHTASKSSGAAAIGSGYPSSGKSSTVTMSTTSAGKSRFDDFKVLANLGSGSFATVHRVKEKASEREYALKQINLSSISEDATREQIQQEIKIHKRLDHAHILNCFETFNQYAIEFLLLELAEGGDLYQYMQKEKLSEPEAARLFTEVAAGIHYLHLLHWMHRDLKPENVLLALVDDTRSAKIADFGEAAESSIQQTKECGSPAYMSPEMCAGDSYDQRIDIWALGILLFEMLTNSWPFVLALTLLDTKKKIMSMDFAFGAWSNLAAPAQELLRSLICKDPGERPPLLKVMAHSWLESHIGTALHDAAEKLEEKHKEDARTVEKITQQMEQLENSTDEPEMRALLKKAIAFEMDNELVQKFRKRYDVVQWQTTRRHQLIKCSYHNSKTDVKNAIATVQEEGLDVPSRWILHDGPKLYARAQLSLLELEMGQRGSNYTAMNFNMDIEAQAQEDSSLDQEELDIIRTFREWRVSSMKSMLEVPALQFVASEELSQTLLERVEKLEKQVLAHRALQRAIVSQNIEDVQLTLEKVREDGLNEADAWMLEAGPRLSARAAQRLEELQRRRDAERKVHSELEEEARALTSSCSILTMEAMIARLEAFGVEGEVLSSLKERCSSLRCQQPLRLQLQACLASSDLDAPRETIKRAREAGLEEPANWVLPEGPSLFEHAASRIERLDAVQVRLEAAAKAFNAEDMQAALEEADALSAPPELTADVRKLFLSLQDTAFVEARIADLAEKEKSDLSDVQLSNLQKLLRKPDKFNVDSNIVIDAARLQRVVECMQMREGGFPVQLKCGVFLRTYAILVPAAQRAEIFPSAGSTCGVSAMSETDLSSAARSLTAQLPKVASGVDLVGDTDVTVTNTTVFLSDTFHRKLEDALRCHQTTPAVKIQAAWRGGRARAAIRAPLKEAVEVNKLLRKHTALIDGALKSTVQSAHEVEEALQAMDGLLGRAMQLQLPLPDVERYLKAREQLAHQAKIARQVEDCKNSLSTVEIEAVLARVALCSLAGPLVDELVKQQSKVQQQRGHRLSLLRCAASNDIDEIVQTTSEARAAGLDASEAWLLPDGHGIWAAAAARLEELQDDKQRRAGLEQSMPQQMRDAQVSLDVSLIRAAIAQSELLGVTGERLDKLKERHKKLEMQNLVFTKLEHCIALDSVEAVASCIQSAKEANLDEEVNWLLADGPRLLPRAERWLSKLQQEASAKNRAREDLEQQISVLSCSLDSSAIEALMRRAEQADVRKGRMQELESRSSSLLTQGPLCEALRNCDAHGIEQAHEAGLSSERSAGWILPDGPRLLGRAIAWQGWKKDISVFDNLQSLGIDDQELVASIRSMLNCLDSKSIEDVSDAVEKAKDLGLDVLESWTGVEHNVASAGVSLVTACQSRLEQLNEEQEILLHSSADLDWQMRTLRALLCPSMQGLLGEPLVKALRERSSALQRQLPFRKALAFSPCEGPKALRKAVGDVKAAGLSVPEAWLLPEGPTLFAAARRHIMGPSAR